MIIAEFRVLAIREPEATIVSLHTRQQPRSLPNFGDWVTSPKL